MTAARVLHQDDPLVCVELEQAVLGALLCAPELVLHARDRLSEEDFAHGEHRAIWRSVLRIVDRGEEPSPMLLAAEIDADTGLGRDYLTQLMRASLVSEADVQIDGLRQLATRRRLRAAAQDLIVRVQRVSEDAREAAEEAQAAIAAAVADPAVGRRSVWAHLALKETLEDCEQALASERLPGVRSGWQALDRIISRIRPGELTYMAGRTGMGKSAVAVALARQAARRGHGVGIVSLEMDARAVAARLASAEAGDIAYEDIIAYRLNLAQRERLHRVSRALKEVPVAVCDRGGLTVDQIGNQIRLWQREFQAGGTPLDLVIIDHLLKIRGRAQRSYVETVTEVSGELLALARNAGVAMVVMTQISRGVEHQEDKRPSLADLKWAGAIEEDGARVVLLYRPEYYLKPPPPEADELEYERYERRRRTEAGKLEMIVAKNRHGRIGTAVLGCDIKTCRIFDVAEETMP